MAEHTPEVESEALLRCRANLGEPGAALAKFSPTEGVE